MVYGVDLPLRLVVIEWTGRWKNWLDMQRLCLWSHVRVDYSNKKQKSIFEKKNIIKSTTIVAFH
jgi:hypothetical protein